MIKKIISTGRSTNSNALDRKFHNTQIAYPIRIVDLSEVSSPKRVVLYITNTAAGFDETVLIWKEFYFVPKNTQPKTFDFWGEYAASGYLGSNHLFEIPVLRGKKYRINDANNAFELMGNATSGAEIQFFNNKEQPVSLILKKSNSILFNGSLNSNATKAFSYKPTVLIGVADSLSGYYNVSNINTEISLLGVATADINIHEGLAQPYQFTLSNITYQ